MTLGGKQAQDHIVGKGQGPGPRHAYEQTHSRLGRGLHLALAGVSLHLTLPISIMKILLQDSVFLWCPRPRSEPFLFLTGLAHISYGILAPANPQHCEALNKSSRPPPSPHLPLSSSSSGLSYGEPTLRRGKDPAQPVPCSDSREKQTRPRGGPLAERESQP